MSATQIKPKPEPAPIVCPFKVGDRLQYRNGLVLRATISSIDHKQIWLTDSLGCIYLSDYHLWHLYKPEMVQLEMGDVPIGSVIRSERRDNETWSSILLVAPEGILFHATNCDLIFRTFGDLFDTPTYRIKRPGDTAWSKCEKEGK